jgi:hypothetical protein
MKKFWMIWVTAVTLIVLVGGAMFALHQHNVSKYCSTTSLDKANKEVPLFNEGYHVADNKNAYSLYYTNCIRTH